MSKTTPALLFVLLALTASYGQNPPKADTDSRPQPPTTSSVARANDPSVPDGPGMSAKTALAAAAQNQPERFGVGGKFRYYLGDTYLNPSFITAPAFRAGLRMAHPPGHSPTAYPADWRQGGEGFGRNYGDALAQRVSFQTARFATGALIREDPRYFPSSSHSPFARSLHAFSYTFIDRSDTGRRMPAFGNFVGAAAAGFVGNTYLPPGFANTAHAGQRATLQFAFTGAGNVYREFAPQMPKPLRVFIEMIGR